MKASDVLATQHFVDKWLPKRLVTDKLGAGRVAGLDPSFLVYDEASVFTDDMWRGLFGNHPFFPQSKRELMTSTTCTTAASSEDLTKLAAAAKEKEERNAAWKAFKTLEADRLAAPGATVDHKRVDALSDAESLLDDAKSLRCYLAHNTLKTVSSVDNGYALEIFATDHVVEDENARYHGGEAPTALDLKERAIYQNFTALMRSALGTLAGDLEALAAKVIAEPVEA